MHILFFSDNFPPEVNAPASRTIEHCREWVKAGHRVTVITCVPNFPKGRIFDGYRNSLWQKEIIDGIRVIRVWTYISANEGFLKRTLDYMSYMFMSFLASLFVHRVNIIVGTSPQFFTVCSAYASSLIKRVPWIFELRDIWPESIQVVGAIKQTKVLYLIEKIEFFLYQRANVIVSVTHAFRTYLMRRGVNGNKIYVVTNGVDLGRFSPRDKDAKLLEELGLHGKFVAGYIGTHGLAHRLDTLLNAAKILKNSFTSDRFRMILLGDGADKLTLRHYADAEELDNVIFLDSVSKDEVSRYWSLLDVSIIHLKKNELFTKVIPSKLFESMGMGIPVLLGVQGESAKIVESEDVGLLFEPEDPQALINGLRYLADNPRLMERLKANGPKRAIHYDRRSLANQMLEILTVTAKRS